MDQYAPFVVWVYGVTAASLVGYVSYLLVKLRREERRED